MSDMTNRTNRGGAIPEQRRPAAEAGYPRREGSPAWPDRRLADLLQIEHPIVLAPMAGLGTVELAASVCMAGGLGSLGCAAMPPQIAKQAIERLRTLTRKPVNVNFFCHRQAPADPMRDDAWRDRLALYYREFGLDPSLPPPRMDFPPFNAAMCAIVEEVRPEVVSFHFGLPEPSLLARVKAAGCHVMSSATTVQEARWLEAHGADAIIAQGNEAGDTGARSSLRTTRDGPSHNKARSHWCRRSLMPSLCRLSPPAGSPMLAGSQPPSRSAPQGCRSGPLTCSVLRQRRRRCIATPCGTRGRRC